MCPKVFVPDVRSCANETLQDQNNLLTLSLSKLRWDGSVQGQPADIAAFCAVIRFELAQFTNANI